MNARPLVYVSTLSLFMSVAMGACGDSSSPSDGDGDLGDGDSGDGDIQGNGASGPTGDGDGDGNGDGDGDSDGPLGGAPSTGGDGPMGGMLTTAGAGGTDEVVTLAILGEPCASPGAFACAENNARLTLICDGDNEWAARETCTGAARCDFNAGPELGICRVPLAQCEGQQPTFCLDGDIAECEPGGFEARTIQECDLGEDCLDGACVAVEDECADEGPSQQVFNCSGDTCGGIPEALCNECGWRGPVESPDEPSIIRLPTDNLCSIEGCDRGYYYAMLSADWNTEDALKFTVGPGWGIVPWAQGVWEPCAEPADHCLIVPPVAGDEVRGVLLVPLSDAPLVRNLKLEVVPPGTTCD